MQTVYTLIRRRVLRRLIFIYVVRECPFYGTLGINGFKGQNFFLQQTIPIEKGSKYFMSELFPWKLYLISLNILLAAPSLHFPKPKETVWVSQAQQLGFINSSDAEGGQPPITYSISGNVNPSPAEHGCAPPCHSICEFVSLTWIKQSDWLIIRSGRLSLFSMTMVKDSRFRGCVRKRKVIVNVLP